MLGVCGRRMSGRCYFVCGWLQGEVVLFFGDIFFSKFGIMQKKKICAHKTKKCKLVPPVPGQKVAKKCIAFSTKSAIYPRSIHNLVFRRG